ncbi:Multidrug/Oligosaccharidyl-lipid/Polysaccharide (MOP) Flippase Superfamily, partial [Thraustotheca clavata]
PQSPNVEFIPLHSPRVFDEVKVLLSLGGPVVFTMLLEILPNTTNIILVSYLSGDTKEYVDAAALSGIYFNITALSVGFGMATAMDTLFNQAFGANKTKRFGVYLQSALTGMALTFIPVFFFNWYCQKILLGLGQDPQLAELTGDFTRITLAAIPFLYIHEIVKKALQAYSIVNPMVIMAFVSNCIHIGLGYFMVHHTSLGFYGAAVARSISSASFPMMLLFLFWRKPIHREWIFARTLKLATEELGSFFRYGIPGMLMVVIEWVAFEVLTLLSGIMADPKVKVGVMSIISQLLTLVYLIYMGLSIAATIRIGSWLGSNNAEAAKASCKAIFCITGACLTITTLFLILLRHNLPPLFIRDDEITSLASTMLLWAVWSSVVDGINAVYHGIYFGMGFQTKATIITAIAVYIFGMPLAIVFAFPCEWELKGLWVGYIIGSLTSVILYCFWLARINWTATAEIVAAQHQH